MQKPEPNPFISLMVMLTSYANWMVLDYRCAYIVRNSHMIGLTWVMETQTIAGCLNAEPTSLPGFLYRIEWIVVYLVLPESTLTFTV